MRVCRIFCLVVLLGSALVSISACTHGAKATKGASGAKEISSLKDLDFKEVQVAGPVELRLMADPKSPEQVAYVSRSRSESFEDGQLRQQKEESVSFVSQADTVRVEEGGKRFTQNLTIVKKDGTASLHDFAMPDIGETLEVTTDDRGRILRAGEYPPNSIFFVPPISLPEGPVSVGDTWTMQATWASLAEGVPYQVDMVSILKGLYECGGRKCAEVEMYGEVSLRGALVETMAFRSMWRGKLFFDIDHGTVLWSRVDSEEQFVSANVRRSVNSCLESALQAPAELVLAKAPRPACDKIKFDPTSPSFKDPMPNESVGPE